MSGPTPAELQVLIAGLSGVAEEVGAVLQRSAFSPNIKERADCSAAVFTPDGQLLAQAEHIPVHLGSMPASVSAVIGTVGDQLGPGDQAIVNDPFAGGTHLNDVTVVAPCFDGGRLIGWVANRAHHADLGGAAPGSLPADATEIHQEGLRMPPMRLTSEVRALLLAASRTPWERAGDLDAQVGANVVGVARLARFADAPVGAVLAHGERRCDAVLRAAPQGRWRASDQLDSTGPGVDQQHPATLCCEVTIDHGDRDGPTITFDFTGTDPQRSGNTNAVRAVTESAVAYVVRSVLDPTLPANAGVMRPVRVVTTEGSVVDARFPVAVGAGNVEVSQRVVDLCSRALAEVLSSRVPAASQGTMNNLLIGGPGVGFGPGGEPEPWVYYETVGGGQGGRPPRPGDRSRTPLPGQSGIHTAMTNTRNTPIEALERAFSLRVLRYRLRRGSGGAGWAPGGEGIERDVQVLEDATVSLITERRASQPWGLAGGEPGAVGENWLLPGGDEARAERLPDKCTIQLKAGDVVRMLTPGGGGWGTPRPSNDL
ncbi:MAG TPA: hydantoinase B/oxoprolinase family protein [Microthrixaceae bacterium]|nr:hydantoinase B/oxoprolinase family protein [Microthrixaceae bacterium]HMX05958.1 hydantoinase B/oxoprolinase family protein [Microthrixaceae bacterium]HMY86596.1 hydantoinase B/oxoprolinase family protein [Microthrixaceae bacterium]HNA35457.1 hydantoinase B/oxoprolinase family protein [Microthrixaceae bacterium]HNB95794.1 hydantoinase B/oxoprolinase family protein [Microthrixaceae bacterium]